MLHSLCSITLSKARKLCKGPKSILKYHKISTQGRTGEITVLVVIIIVAVVVELVVVIVVVVLMVMVSSSGSRFRGT
jgi:hypothetical protein